MKYLHLVTVAAASCGVMMALASNASGTVLCKTETNPCSSHYAAGTPFEGKASQIRIEFPSTEIKCESSTIKGETSTGSSTETVEAVITGLTFEKCSCPTLPVWIETYVHVLETPSFKFHDTGNPYSGVVTDGHLKITVNCAPIAETCIYASTSSPESNLGTLSGGPEPVLSLIGSLNWAKGDGGPIACYYVNFRGNYSLSTPSPLYVEPG